MIPDKFKKLKQNNISAQFSDIPSHCIAGNISLNHPAWQLYDIVLDFSPLINLSCGRSQLYDLYFCKP